MSFSIKSFQPLVSQEEKEENEEDEKKEKKEENEEDEKKEKKEKKEKNPISIQRGSNHGISIQNTSSSVDDY